MKMRLKKQGKFLLFLAFGANFLFVLWQNLNNYVMTDFICRNTNWKFCRWQNLNNSVIIPFGVGVGRMKIAFFDSGVGGLSVLHYAMKVLPREQFVFFADEDHVPYGVKTRDEILRFVGEAFDFLMGCGVKAIVTACNTATSVAVKEMRRRYEIPIIGMEPAAKRALDLDGEHRVLVVATPITVRGQKMKVLIEHVDKEHLVDLLPLPKLVEFAERSEFRSPEVRKYLEEELSPYDFSRYSSLVLGCTHFNYFKDTFREILPENVRFVDGNEGTVRELIRQLRARDALEDLPPSVEYVYSGRKVEDPAERERLKGYMDRLEEMYFIP